MKLFKHRNGAAVLEGFFVIFAMMALAFGCIEFGHFFYIKHTLQGASREGARAAATGTSNTEVINTVKASMDAAGIPSTKYTISITDTATPTPSPITITATTPTSGTAIVVKVSATWGNIGIHALPPAMNPIGDAKVVVGSTTMRREG